MPSAARCRSCNDMAAGSQSGDLNWASLEPVILALGSLRLGWLDSLGWLGRLNWLVLLEAGCCKEPPMTIVGAIGTRPFELSFQE